MLLALGRELAVGRVVVPLWPWVPAVGRDVLLGRALADAEPGLLEVVLLMLPVVGREAVVPPLSEPVLLPPLTLAPVEVLPPVF